MSLMRSRLLFKIMLSYVVLLLAVLGAVDWFMAARIHENYVNLERNRLLTAAEVLSRNLRPEQSIAARQAWAHEMGDQINIRITLIDSNGNVLTDSQFDPAQMENHSNRPEVREALRTGHGTSIRYSRTLRKNELYLALNVTLPGQARGILRLALPLQEVTEGFRSAQRGLFRISAFLFILALALGYWLTRSLVHRIESIQKFSENVAHGNLDARVKKTADDELGSLAESLNSTANELQGMMDKLRAEKTRIGAILEGMRAGVLATDRDGRITLMNPPLTRVLEVDPKNCLGKKVIEVVRNAELKEILDRVWSEKKEATAIVNLTTPSARCFEVVAVPLQNADALPSGVVAVMHDITRLKELENVRKDFVANVSHELRTPLTSIRGFAETLLEGGLEDKMNNRRFVEIIKSHAIRLSDLTKDLLTLATLESESLRLNLEPIEVPALVSEVIESARPLGQQKGQEIVTSISDKLPLLRADREKLLQVLVNLLDNAMKFTPEKGKISLEIGLTSDMRYIEFHVCDSGIGIPSSDLPRVFERFYRVDKSRSRDQGGTGLGLAIAKHIVEAHKGRIEVKSTLEQGSDFWFILPLA